MTCRSLLLPAEAALLLLPAVLPAATITVTNAEGEPLALVMVTRTVPGTDTADTSDNGYPRPGILNKATPQHTRFTNGDGQIKPVIYC